MEEKWKIEFYKTTTGSSPVDEFIEQLDFKAQNKIIQVLALDGLLDYKSRTQN